MTSTHEPNTLLQWHEGLSVGDAKIDGEHKNLIQRVNDLNTGLVAQASREEILRLIQRVLDTATSHFASEEQLLRDRGYPNADQHRRIHERITAEFYGAMDDFASTPSDLTWLIKGLNISRALMEHLAREDMKYRDFFFSRG
jgi:hemerythrin-like metal-binding protein